MTESTSESLQAVHLQQLDTEMEQALLAYVNLPPVGCINDRVYSADWETGNHEPFEIASGPRKVLLERRGANGRFDSVRQLLGMDGFGRRDFNEIVTRLGDVERYGNRARPVWGGPEANEEFFKLLESAQKYIHLSTYIVGGEAGLRLARLLAKKRKEGVQVRIMFCATGFVISGSPSGTGFVSRMSELRSWMLNDMYVRKRIIAELYENDVPFINNVPIGRHWRRRDLRAQGIKNEKTYYSWLKERGVPDEWAEEQVLIDKECTFGFSNVDHRKMVIVDGERAFVGSQNLADSYFYDNELSTDPSVNRRNWQWHDNSTILEGGAVRELNRLFAMRWMLSGGDMYDHTDSFYNPPAKRVGNAAVTIEATIPGDVQLPMAKNIKGFWSTFFGFDIRPVSEGKNPVKERLLHLPRLAQKNFYVEHCYPADASLLEEWARLAGDVPEFQMVVPQHYDTSILGTECDRYYPELADAGIQLHGYNRAIMHSKILAMDGYYVATGSYNLNLRSARADLENEFFIQCAEYGGAVHDRIQGDFTECTPIQPSALDRYRSHRSVPVIDALFRYLLL